MTSQYVAIVCSVAHAGAVEEMAAETGSARHRHGDPARQQRDGDRDAEGERTDRKRCDHRVDQLRGGDALAVALEAGRGGRKSHGVQKSFASGRITWADVSQAWRAGLRQL